MCSGSMGRDDGLQRGACGCRTIVGQGATLNCTCVRGYYGDACQLQCPGATYTPGDTGLSNCCSGHGRWNLQGSTGSCACYGQWTASGKDGGCDTCKDGYAGEDCNTPCLQCENGVCNQGPAGDGKCTCNEHSSGEQHGSGEHSSDWEQWRRAARRCPH